MKFYGIDFGATNSCLAFYDDQEERTFVVTNYQESEQQIASAVAFDPIMPEMAHVGSVAKAIIEDIPECGCMFFKRYLGSDEEIMTLKDGTIYHAEDITAILLRAIKEYGEEATNEEVKDVVVTVPAYFGYAERQATSKAVEAAGLNLIRMLPDPIAAVYGYFENYNGSIPENILVCDFGGSTFDVSLVKTYGDLERAKILAFDGDHHLGGEDWDTRLCQLLVEKIEEEGFDLDDSDLSVIHSKVENLKKRLSHSLFVPFRSFINNHSIRFQVSREEFEACTADLLLIMKTRCQNFLARTKAEIQQVDCVLLTGGSMLMPMVRTMVEELLPGKEILLAEPQFANAKGASIAHYMICRDEMNEKLEAIDFLEKVKALCEVLRHLDMPLHPTPSKEQIFNAARKQLSFISTQKPQEGGSPENEITYNYDLDVIQKAISNDEITAVAIDIVSEERLAVVRKGIAIMAKLGLDTYTKMDIESQAKKTGLELATVEQLFVNNGFRKIQEIPPIENRWKHYERYDNIKKHLRHLWRLEPDTKDKVKDLYDFLDYFSSFLKDNTFSLLPAKEKLLELDREAYRGKVEEWLFNCAINLPRDEHTKAFVNLLHECLIMLSSIEKYENYLFSVRSETCVAFEHIDCVTASALLDQRFADVKIKEIAGHFGVDHKMALDIYNNKIKPLTYIP